MKLASCILNIVFVCDKNECGLCCVNEVDSKKEAM